MAGQFSGKRFLKAIYNDSVELATLAVILVDMLMRILDAGLSTTYLVVLVLYFHSCTKDKKAKICEILSWQ